MRFDHSDTSARLQAALAAGTRPDPAQLDALVERCAVEPDFFVRDMLTWALTRQPAALPRVLRELRSEIPQARSQALHTLSKIGDPGAWPAITRELLHDADDEVARAAWRTAVGLVPEGEEQALAAELMHELGRGGRDVQRSLTRALLALRGAARPALEHAQVTLQVLNDPELSVDDALHHAKRRVALGPDADR
ncbi:HEAT repeat domain-containing protein [Pseudonocardia oroxyli]|uniref:HEAT repeat-containing protein n=1 Tax=Pseudonocardia oroxyli TaxID=366584 RepID=A0A1G7LU46_PSEOR|nr:HEAT repeat domain-containing protein [Pseudonocardia oroxyli]SDF52884.1 HEAT repeat-containing protein [Pseudonocardia oroxyli]